MARLRTTYANCLNIAGENTDRRNYIEAFKYASDLKIFIQGRGSKQYFIKVTKSNDNEIRGILSRFTDIDKSLKWFNTNTTEPATSLEENKILIPKELKPNLQQFFFIFNIINHKLFLESKSMTGKLNLEEARNIFSFFLNQEEVRVKHGFFSINILTDKEQFKDIFNNIKVKHIEIRIDRPNPDDFGEYERAFQSRLSDMNVRTYKESYDAVPGGQIIYDEDLEMKAAFASVNGEINATGKNDENVTVKVSSDSYPVTGFYQHSDDSGSEWSAFENAINNLSEQTNKEVI